MNKILLLIFTATLIFLNYQGVVFAVTSCPSSVPITQSCPLGCKEITVMGAERICSSNDGKITNPALDANVGSGNQGENIFAKIIAAVINLFFIAGSLAVLVYLLMGGLAYITSEGDKGKIEIAKSRLTSAVLGIVIIAATYTILTLLGQFLGINFFTSLIIQWPTITY